MEEKCRYACATCACVLNILSYHKHLSAHCRQPFRGVATCYLCNQNQVTHSYALVTPAGADWFASGSTPILNSTHNADASALCMHTSHVTASHQRRHHWHCSMVCACCILIKTTTNFPVNLLTTLEITGISQTTRCCSSTCAGHQAYAPVMDLKHSGVLPAPRTVLRSCGCCRGCGGRGWSGALAPSTRPPGTG